MQAVNQRRWDGIPNLRATKRLGCEYIDANAARLWELTREWQHDAARSAGSAFMEWLKVPGLGLVKAGFAVQLTIGEVGCLDTHNIQRLGLRKADMQVNKAKLANLATRASRYMVECKRQGGAEKLWDSWCCYVAKGQPKQWANAQAVSEWHWRVLDQQPF